MMRCAKLAFVFLLAATPALAQMGGGGGGGGGGGYGGIGGSGGPGNRGGGGSSLPPPTSNRPDPEGDAQRLREDGRCDKAVPALKRYADRGVGYEVSQYDLGLCLLELSLGVQDEKKAEPMRQDGAQWIVRAANAGFAKAQAKAVTLYLDSTGVDGDKVEAEKWAMLYRGNSLRLVIGLPDIDQQITDRLDGALSDADRTQAQARADAWTAQAQPREP